MPSPLRVATWNIHRARGADGRTDPVRIETVLAQEVCPPGGTDILALQEADTEDAPQKGLLDLERIASLTGLSHAQPDPALRWGPESHGFHGTVLFLGPEIQRGEARLLDLPGLCPRGAVVMDLRSAGGPVRLVATHLSLSQPLRLVQMRIIGQHLARRTPMPTLVVGDLNEWRPWGGLALSPRVVGRRLHGGVARSFPVRRPLFPLDRILSDRPGAVRGVRALDGPGIRAASDHRPLRAEVSLAA